MDFASASDKRPSCVWVLALSLRSVRVSLPFMCCFLNSRKLKICALTCSFSSPAYSQIDFASLYDDSPFCIFACSNLYLVWWPAWGLNLICVSVCRRGDSLDREPRRQAGKAQAQAPLPCKCRPVGLPHHCHKCRDGSSRTHHPAEGP